MRGGRGRLMYLCDDVESFAREIRELAKDFDYPIETEEYPPPRGSPEWQESFAALKTRHKTMCHALHTVSRLSASTLSP